MEINLIKSKIPILWIDTSVIIKLAKIKKGENIANQERERHTEIFKLIEEKIKQKKIICVKGEQVEEIKQGRRLVDECDKIIVRLSYGVQAKSPYGIELLQQAIFMDGYFHETDVIDLYYRDGFYEDPVEELLSNKKFIISIKETVNEEEISAAINRKEKLLRELENLRQECVNNKISYKQQFEREQEGQIEAIRIYADRLTMGNFDFNEYMALVGDSLMQWKAVSGQKNDLAGLLRFYKSEYFKKLPWNDIKSKLFASITTQNGPIESGDSIDITNIATMAPYCNAMITDKKMRNRIHKLNINNDYDVRVFSLNNFDEIISYLNDI